MRVTSSYIDDMEIVLFFLESPEDREHTNSAFTYYAAFQDELIWDHATNSVKIPSPTRELSRLDLPSNLIGSARDGSHALFVFRR